VIFKVDNLHVVLDRQKVYKTTLEKAFFFILWRFYIFTFNNVKNGSSERLNFSLEIGLIGCQKSQILR
jgi:hypothetical protein